MGVVVVDTNSAEDFIFEFCKKREIPVERKRLDVGDIVIQLETNEYASIGQIVFEGKTMDQVLPLSIRNYIRHQHHNRILTCAVDSVLLSVEVQDTKWNRMFPPELSFVKCRMSETTIYLKNGWVLNSSKFWDDVKTEYLKHCTNSVWRSSEIIASLYIGMGHYEYMGYHLPSKQFFIYPEGGFNELDRDVHLRRAACMTDEQLVFVDWSILFD